MSHRTPPPVVLIIEDDEPLAELFEQYLTPQYTVRTAHDGETGLAQLDDEVAVVLLDRRLPDMTGTEVLDEIGRQENRCQVAMVSGIEPDYDVLEMGFDDYVTKPVTKAELSGLVDRLVKRVSYDESLRRYLSLLSKRSVLELQKTESELETHDEYRRLIAASEALERQLDENLAQLEESEFDTLFRAII